MKNFSRMLICAACMMLQCALMAADVVDVYNFKMSLKVPRVYDNTGSQGYRKYQTQHISGQMLVEYADDANQPKITLTNLVNTTHKLSNGSYVTYTAYEDEDFTQNFVYIGSNKTLKFYTPSISFAAIADPSYNIGRVESDNSLYLYFAGSGSSGQKKAYAARISTSLSGYVVGQIGCGCSVYTHTSPTRIVWYNGPSSLVNDIASVYGSWAAKFKTRYYN